MSEWKNWFIRLNSERGFPVFKPYFELTQEEKEFYTRILKGHLNLGAVKFLHGCSGTSLDYLARLLTADYKYKSASVLSFVRYPFSFMAIVDLLSILPSFTAINGSFKVLRVMRMFRALRILRVLKIARYSHSIRIIGRVFRRSKDALVAVGSLALAYVLISALVILNLEPDSFDNFFEAIYWATVSLTTVGYGDIYPVTTVGRVFTMLSSIFGIAIVALPSGILTAGYMSELAKETDLPGEEEP